MILFPGKKSCLPKTFQMIQKESSLLTGISVTGRVWLLILTVKKYLHLTEAEHGDNAVVMEPRMKKKSGYMPANFTVELDMYVPRAANADDDIRSHWVGLNFYGTDEPIDSYDDLDLSPEKLGFYTAVISDGSKQLPDDVSNENFTNKWHHLAIAYKNKQMKIYLDQNRTLRDTRSKRRWHQQVWSTGKR